MVTPTSFPVGGTVTGLVSSGLVLWNNATDEVTIGSGATAFAFPTVVPNGGVYSVSVKTQPNIGPLQVCSVTNGDGSVAGASVTSITVTCVTKTAKFLYVPNPGAGTVSGTPSTRVTAPSRRSRARRSRPSRSSLRDCRAERQVPLRNDPRLFDESTADLWFRAE